MTHRVLAGNGARIRRRGMALLFVAACICALVGCLLGSLANRTLPMPGEVKAPVPTLNRLI